MILMCPYCEINIPLDVPEAWELLIHQDPPLLCVACHQPVYLEYDETLDGEGAFWLEKSADDSPLRPPLP